MKTKILRHIAFAGVIICLPVLEGADLCYAEKHLCKVDLVADCGANHDMIPTGVLYSSIPCREVPGIRYPYDIAPDRVQWYVNNPEENPKCWVGGKIPS